MNTYELLIVFFALAAYCFYISEMRGGSVRPQIGTWCIWAFMEVATALSMHCSDGVNTLIVISAAGTLLIALASFRRGEFKTDVLDMGCIAAALVGMGLWLAFDEPRLSLAMNLAVSGLAAVPTVHRAVDEPEKESKWGWTSYTVACVVTVLIVPAWTFGHAAQPLLYLAINLVMMFMLWRKRKK